MKEERLSNNVSDSRTWFEKITEAFLSEPKDRNQLVEILRHAESRNLLDADSLAMIEGVMHVSEMQVRDIMIPRSQMVVVEKEAQPTQFLPTILDSAHSRFPVIGESRDEILGILLAKDTLAYFANPNDNNFDVRDILRPAVFVPESKRLNVLLKEFRSNRNHMAIVINEYGGVAGLVTIEDVIEQIVGEIEDEHDISEESYIMKHGNQQFAVKAITPIEDFNEYFSSNLEDNEYDTIGGLVLHELGHLPTRGENVTVDNFDFSIVRADKRRIHLLQLTLQDPPENSLSTTTDTQREN